jgi:hypothetical protein
MALQLTFRDMSSLVSSPPARLQLLHHLFFVLHPQQQAYRDIGRWDAADECPAMPGVSSSNPAEGGKTRRVERARELQRREIA